VKIKKIKNSFYILGYPLELIILIWLFGFFFFEIWRVWGFFFHENPFVVLVEIMSFGSERR